jgi:hypothetical protein
VSRSVPDDDVLMPSAARGLSSKRSTEYENVRGTGVGDGVRRACAPALAVIAIAAAPAANRCVCLMSSSIRLSRYTPLTLRARQRVSHPAAPIRVPNQSYFPCMATTTRTEPSGAPDLDEFTHHWQDEADAAFLYRRLAAAETDTSKRDIYQRLAEVEDRHVQVWSDLLARHGRQLGPHRPTARTRLLAFLGKHFGPGFLLPMLLAEEGREVKAYLDMHRTTHSGVDGRDEALTLARESAEHATTLNTIAGRSGEPWHRTGAGGFLRNVVYGFNDGLTANFGLVAGVLGAA